MGVVNTKSNTMYVGFDPSNPAVNANFSGSMAVYFDESEPTVKVKTGETLAVYFDPASPSVNASFSAASLEVVPSTGSRIMYDESYQAQRVLIAGSQPSASLAISSIGETVAVYFDPSNPAVNASFSGSIATYFDPSEPTVKTMFGDVSAEGVNTESDTTGPLWATNTWTGAGEQNHYSHVAVSLITDEIGTLYFDFSNDGTNWDSIFPTSGFSIAADTHEMHTGVKMSRYFRPRFVGTGGRTYFRLYTHYSDASLDLNAPLSASIAEDADAQISKAVIIAQATGSGDFLNIQSTNNGNLKVAIEEISDGLDVGNGSVGSETQRITIADDSTGNLEYVTRVRNIVDGTLSTVTGITNTIKVKADDGTFAVYFSPSEPTVKAEQSGTFAVYFDQSNPKVNLGSDVVNVDATGQGDVPVTLAGERPDVQRVHNVVDGTISTVTSVGSVGGTVAVYFDPSNPKVNLGTDIVNVTGTILISNSATGTYAGTSDLGKTLASPISGSNIKVFAYSLQTTGVVSTVAKFTNGAGSATDLWTALVTPASSTSETRGANMAVEPPGYLFSTGTNTTLALYTGNASLIHYSVSYFRESA